MGRNKSKNQIPDRWESYNPLGKRIPETRFICCKCPLKEEICWKLPSKSKWFTPQCLFRMLAEDNLTLGLVIDLTNTDRYYHKTAFTYAGVEYVKIYTPGHDEPGQQSVDMFREAVQTFEKKYAGGDTLIAVHCTHGVNRTGYQLCRYLIEECGWSFEKAVQTFNLARGHPIERENYLMALQTIESNKFGKKRRRQKERKEGHKKRHHKGNSYASSDSSTSSADSLFKPVLEKPVPAKPSIAPLSGAAAGSVVPPVAPIFNPAVVQQVWANMAQNMRAMLNQQMGSLLPRPGAPPMAVPSFPTQFPTGLPIPRLTSVPPSGKVGKQTTNSSSDTSVSSGSESETSAEEEEEEVGESEKNSQDDEALGNEEFNGDEQEPETSGGVKVPPPDWEHGGKVEKKPTKSVSQKRRERHKRIWEMHKTLQSGNFWKIREMQKERYGF